MKTPDEIYAECLGKYARKQPKKFLQLDVFFEPDGGDDVMRPDTDGDCIIWGATHELMRGPDTVRVLVPESTTPENVARSLRKLAAMLDHDGSRMFSEYLVGKCLHCNGTGKPPALINADGIQF